MVKFKYFIIFIFFCFFSFFSCKKYVDTYSNGRPLDVQKLVEMKYKWRVLKIKNYSFTYEFETYMPYYCIGHVIVKNGVGTVTFDTKSNLKPNKDDPYKKLYYMASIEDVFDNVLERYFDLKKKKDERKNNYLDYYALYDKEYFFLNYAVCDTCGPTPNGQPIGCRPSYFSITDFKMLE